MSEIEKQVKKQDVQIDETSLIAIIIALFIPPVGVAIKKGIGSSFFINCLLTLLGFIPGIVHALFVILNHKKVWKIWKKIKI